MPAIILTVFTVTRSRPKDIWVQIHMPGASLLEQACTKSLTNNAYGALLFD